jgi:hypothetical protein
MDQNTMGTFDDSNSPNPQCSIFGGLQFPPTSPLSTLAAAQYHPTPGATFPNPAAAAPGPLGCPKSGSRLIERRAPESSRGKSSSPAAVPLSRPLSSMTGSAT